MCATNDPLGQTHSPASRDNYFYMKTCFVLRYVEKWEGTDVQTTHAKIVITTDRNFGSAKWIKRKRKKLKNST